jgi:CBS domain-containing protein
MKVKDVMRPMSDFCSTEDSLMKCADIMRLRDCGVVPIVDEDETVVGMLTDRDLCLAVVARNRKASDVLCKEVINRRAVVCSGDDKLENALRKMRKYQIKRLAAVGKDGKLTGILSITDIMLQFGKIKT